MVDGADATDPTVDDTYERHPTFGQLTDDAMAAFPRDSPGSGTS